MNWLKQARTIVGTEGPVLLVVICGLLLGELGMRLVENRLSKDVAHLKSFEKIAADLNPYDADPGMRVLFLGNSMTRYGIDPFVFQQEFCKQSDRPIRSVKMNPDNTALADWDYAYRNFFSEEGRHPDVLVIGFEGGHLRDRPSNHPDRLARYYCDSDDWLRLMRFDLPSFEDRASFLVSSLSTMYSNRDRLQRRVLDAVIPEYRDSSQQLNRRQTSLAERTLPPPTYHRLKEFIDLVKSENVRLVLVAMPIAEKYELDPGLLELLKQEHVELVDARQVPGIVPEMFPDGIHMTEDASKLYTAYVADHLAGDASQMSGGPETEPSQTPAPQTGARQASAAQR